MVVSSYDLLSNLCQGAVLFSVISLNMLLLCLKVTIIFDCGHQFRLYEHCEVVCVQWKWSYTHPIPVHGFISFHVHFTQQLRHN